MKTKTIIILLITLCFATTALAQGVSYIKTLNNGYTYNAIDMPLCADGSYSFDLNC